MDPDYKDLRGYDQYLISLYFIIQTITTVGYGDNYIKTNSEKVMCIFLMILGVVGFISGTSALTTLLDNYDKKDIYLKGKIEVLNDIQYKYNLPLKIYNRTK